MAVPGKLNMTLTEQHIGSPKRALAGDNRAVRIAGSVLMLLFGAAAAINFGAFLNLASLLPMTHLVASVLSLYLLAEAWLYIRRSDAFGLLSPALLALVFHFFLAYVLGITGTVFEPRILERFGNWLPSLDAALAETLILAGVASFAMLRGYALALRVARRLRRRLERTPLLRRELRFNIVLMLAIQFFYFGLVIYAIDAGAYGLLSTIETRAQNVNIQQFLNLGLGAGTLSYFLILMRYFEWRAAGRAVPFIGTLVVIMIGLHVATGALSAFKIQIVLPFVVAGSAYFIATGRMPLRFIALASVALIVSYIVVEPFRAYLGLRDQPPTSISEAVTSLGTALELRDQLNHVSDISLAEAIVSRFDLSGMTALAIDYVDQGRLSFERRAEFQDSILFAPILAYVPRAIWQDKPSYSEGVWFNQNVRGMRHDETTSVGMGPIGVLYMAGGTVAVLLGFFGFGVLQALIFEGVGRAGPGGLIIYLSVANPLVIIPTSFGPTVTGVLRMLPVTFVAQYLLLKRSQHW